MSREPVPGRVREGRDRILEGVRLPEYPGTQRPYYCRGCQAEQRGVLVPRGWYQLTRASGSREERPMRLGLSCSIRCLFSQQQRLCGIEDDLGDDFDRVPSPFRQRPSL